jgi:predicted metal-dependent phosphoesterase TrpH
MGAVDLHTHTTASDGALMPRALVREAVKHGVRVLAVTDHDTTDGLGEALDEGVRHPGLEIIPGLEINCDVAGGEVHVLGYFVDYQQPPFQAFLEEQRKERRDRIHRIAERLAELGVPIDPAEVFALVKEGSAGRPHIAQVMVQRGHVKSVREAFDRFLHTNGPANVPRKRLTPADAVRFIAGASGVPVLAHPGIAGKDDLIDELIAAGLQGIEVYYAEHTPKQIADYLDRCRRHDLVATGGSDFHGAYTGRTNPPGTPRVPMTAVDGLRERAARARASRAAPPAAPAP